MKNDYEIDVEEKCLYPVDDNKKLLDEIKSNLGNILKNEFEEQFDIILINKIHRKIIAEWLMMCPLNFEE